MNKIAAIIPIYNGRGIVDKCLKKLEEQSLKLNEIICVDDASLDDSSTYIKENFPDVTVLKNKINIGASGTYGIGLYYAYLKGYEWFWLLDQDSLPHKKALEKLLVLGKKHVNRKLIFTSTLVCPIFCYIYLYKRFKYFKQEVDPNKPYFTLIPNFSGLLLHRNMIEEVGLPLVELSMDLADWEYIIRSSMLGWKIIVIPKSIVWHFGGIPKIKPSIYRRYHFILKDGKIIRIFNKLGVISIYSESRYFTRGRNSLLLLRQKYVPRYIKLYIFYWIFGMFIKLLFVEEKKRSKLRSYLEGLFYGLIEDIDLKGYVDSKNRSIRMIRQLYLKNTFI